MNEKFLELYKTLLQESNPQYKLQEVEYIQKIAVFDEIKFMNDLHRIRFLELSSQPKNNFMLIAIDGTVYQYNLGTKELVMQFKSVNFLSFKLNIASN